MQQLTAKDQEKYLAFGGLCTPFMESALVKEKVLDYQRFCAEKGQTLGILESIAGWMRHPLNKHATAEEKRELKFRRTAKEIWKSGFVTGCTDNGVVFATLAKQMGIPCSILNTAAKSMLEEISQTGTCKNHAGHKFCECFLDGKWVLFDPTKRELIEDYNLEKLTLPYTLGGDNIYFPYRRGVVKEYEDGILEHCAYMRQACRKILNNDPEIVL